MKNISKFVAIVIVICILFGLQINVYAQKNMNNGPKQNDIAFVNTENLHSNQQIGLDNIKGEKDDFVYDWANKGAEKSNPEPEMILAGTTCTVSASSPSICKGSSVTITRVTSNVGTSGTATGTAQYTTDGGANWYTLTKNTSVSSTYYPTETTIYGTRVLGYLSDVQCGPSYTTVTVNPSPGATSVSGAGTFCNSATLTATPPTYSGNEDFGDGTLSQQYAPLYGYYNYSRSASLILRSEVSANPGTITHLAVYVGTANTHTFTGISIRLKKTTATTCPTTFPGDGTQVYTGSYTFSTTGWVTFNITDFNWNSDNLLIEWQHGSTTYSSNYPYFAYTTQGSYLQTSAYSDASLPTTGSNTYNRPNYRLTFSNSTFPTYWQSTTSNGTSTATPSTSQSVSSSGTYYFRAGTSAGCWGTQGSAAVTIEPTPVAPTLSSQSPTSGNTICVGYNSGTATFTGGSGGTANDYDYSINGGSTWSAYTSGSAITTTGGSGSVKVRGRREGNYCTSSSYNTYTLWNFSSSPSAPTLNTASPGNGTSICAGYNSGTVTFNAGSGGSTGAADEYQYSINGGSTYASYTPGNAINTSSASGNIIVQARRTGGSYGCSATAWTTRSTWYLASSPTAPTLNAATPATSNSICAGYSVSATANAGSGGSTGSTDEYRYSINNGSSWTTGYTIGNSITTTGATGSVIIQSRRTSGSYGCSNTDWSTIATWTVASAPVAPTLGTATPATTNSICAGYSVSATASGGSGGSTGAANVYQYSINNGGNWTAYTIGNSITTTGATGSVIIQSRRTAGSYGCSTTAWSTIASWTVSAVPAAPTLSSASPNSGTAICAGYNSGTVTATGGSGGSTGAANVYRYSINGGGNWSTYTNGAAITTTGATGSVIVQSQRTAGSYGCSTTAWSTLSTWTVASTPIAPTLGSASPANGSSVCAGYNIGTVTGIGGSGGSTGAINKYRVSTDGGSSWADYTSGNAINTSSATGNIVVQSQRTSGSYGCVDSDWSTISTWTLSSNPVVPTLSSASPTNNTVVCAGFNTGTVTGTGGSGGSTGAANEYQVSIDGGSNYSVYTNGAAITTTGATGNIIVQARRTAGSYGCSNSSWTTLNTWVLGSTLVPPSLTETIPASGTNICAGFNTGTVSITAGTGGSSNAADVYQYSINNGSDYNTYTSASAITTTGATGSVIVRAMRTGGDYGCSSTGWATLSTWNINNVPSAPTLNVATPATSNSICAGYSVSATANAGSGGSTGSTDEYRYSINNGFSWTVYTSGSSITTTGATGSVIVQSRRTSGSYGCSNTDWSTIATWTVASAPVAPTLGTATPATTNSICAGYSVSATASGGSGGSTGAANVYQYSINNGGNWTAYTIGNSINTTGAIGSVIVQSQRTAGSYGCSTTAWSTIASWTVSAVPAAPTLSSASPNSGTTICAGYNSGTVTATGGSGGSTGAANVYQYSINGGSNWNTYTNGAAITTTGATGSVIVQSQRTAGSYGCSTTAWSTLSTWTVASTPTAPTLGSASPANGSSVCAGYNIGTVTGIGGSGGSTGAINKYRLSINGGSSWNDYTSGSAINTSTATGNIVVQSQRTSGSYGCVDSDWSTISTWTLSSNPVVPTLSSASPTNNTVVCAGFNTGSVTGTGGSGGSTGAANEYQVSIDGGSSYSAYTSGANISTTGATGNIIVQARRTSGSYGCSNSSWTTLNTWVLGSTPVQPSLTEVIPASGTNICAGFNTGTVSITAGTGGSSNAADVYQYSINNGSDYNTYTSASAITTTGATGSVIVRAMRTGGDYGCSSTGWATLSTWNINNVPLAPTIILASPASGTAICAGFNTGNVTANAGSGGSDGAVDEYDYSIYGGTNRLTYIPGNAIITSGGTGSVIVRARRTGGSYGCSSTSWSELSSWSISSLPQAPTLSVASPTNGSTICIGYNSGTVTVTGGSGGSTGAANEYQYSINGGSNYSSYTSGDAINTDAASGSIMVQARRTSGSYGCNNTAWNTISSWSTVNPPQYPTLNTATPDNATSICSGANPSATFNAGSGGSGCSDSYRYSVNGVDWNVYVPSVTTITAGAGGTTVTIQGRRQCSATGCDDTENYTTLASWTVVDDPSLSDASFSNEIICSGGSTEVTSILSGGAGNFQLQWKYLNGASWENVTNNHPAGALYTGANTEGLSIDGVTAAGTYRYKLTAAPTGAGCGTAESNSQTFVVVNQASVSISASDLTVCTNAFVSYTASGSGGAGAGQYKWQSSSNNIDWLDIGSETTSEYTVPTILTGSIYYRAAYKTANSGCDWQYSDARKVTVVSQPSLTSSSLTNSTICLGGSTVISSTLSNGTGTPTYQWQYYNGSDWNSVSNTTPIGATYSNQTTNIMTVSGISVVNSYQYRLAATMTGGGCNIAHSDAGILVVVADPSLSTPVFTNSTICSEGSTDVSSILSDGTGTPSYQWQYYNGAIWANVIDNIPSDATYTNATTNTLSIAGTSTPGTYLYKLGLTMSGSGCNATESVSKSYTIVADPSLSVAAFTISTICAGGTTQVSSVLSNGTGTPTYQWLYNNSGSWENVSNGTPTGASYSGSDSEILTIAGNTALGSHQYKLSVSMDGEACNSTESVAASYTVVANLAAQTISETPASGSEICIGSNVSATFSGGSGGTGTITDIYKYSTSSGSSWLDYTPGSSITTGTLGTNVVRIRTQRTATGEGCLASSYNTVQWTVVPDPELSAASLTNSTICSGGSTVISSTLSNGTGTPTYQWQYYNGSDWNSVSNGVPIGAIYSNQTTDEMSISGITTIGSYQYRLKVSMSGLDCNIAYSEDATLGVVSNPSLSALSYTNSAICVGGTTTISSSLSDGTGSPTYTWEYYNGSDWNTVSNGAPAGSSYSNSATDALTISAVTATGSHQYRLKVSMDGNGCAATQTVGLAYSVAADPVAQTISESPIEGTVICQNGLVSAGFIGGSGGAVSITNHYEYSVNGSSDWVAYTPGDQITASESGVNQMRFRTWRTATGSGCDNSSMNLKQWTVVDNPQAPTATKVPNTETVCQNQLLYIESVQDEGGGTGTCEIQFRYSSNSGVDWSLWGTSIPSFSSVIDESNRIQARKQCDGYACVANVATFIWDAIDEMELENPSFNYPVICTEGTTQVTTAIIGSAGQDQPQWQYLNTNTLEWNNVANGTPSGAVYTNSNSLTMTISGIEDPGLYYYRAVLNIPNSGCEETQSDAGTLRVTEQPSAPTFASKSPNVADVCAGQSLTLSTAAGGGTNSGVACSFEYRYFNGSISAESSSAPTFAAAAGTNYIEARRIDCQPGCNASAWSRVAEWNAEDQASVSITNNAEITCQNDALTLNIQVSNGTGSHSYQWQSSTNNVDWSDILTETAASYTVPSNSVGITYYRIKFQSSGSGCNVAYSPSYQVDIRDIPEVSGIQIGDYVWVGNVDNNWFVPANWRLYDGASYVIPSIAPASSNNIFIVDENSCVNRKVVNISGIEVEFKNIIIDEGFELRLID